MDKFSKDLIVCYATIFIVMLCALMFTGCVSIPQDTEAKTETEVISEGLNQALSTIVIFGRM